MGLFAKKEWKDYEMSFELVIPDEMHRNLGSIALILTGEVEGKTIYCYSNIQLNFLYKENFGEMIDKLKDSKGKKIKATILLKDGKPSGGSFNANSLVKIYNDEKYASTRVITFAIFNDKSEMKDLIKE